MGRQRVWETAVSHRGFAREWIVREEMIKSDYAYTYMLLLLLVLRDCHACVHAMSCITKNITFP